MIKTITPQSYDFSVVIEFPTPNGKIVPGWGVSVYLTEIARTEIRGVESISVHADAQGVAWAEFRAWADPDGNIVSEGEPYFNNNQVIFKTYTARVTEVLSRRSFNQGHVLGYAKSTIKKDKPERRKAVEEARDLLGLSDDTQTVTPKGNPAYEVYVQSKSVNRKLVPGTNLIVMK